MTDVAVTKGGGLGDSSPGGQESSTTRSQWSRTRRGAARAPVGRRRAQRRRAAGRSRRPGSARREVSRHAPSARPARARRRPAPPARRPPVIAASRWSRYRGRGARAARPVAPHASGCSPARPQLDALGLSPRAPPRSPPPVHRPRRTARGRPRPRVPDGRCCARWCRCRSCCRRGRRLAMLFLFGRTGWSAGGSSWFGVRSRSRPRRSCSRRPSSRCRSSCSASRGRAHGAGGAVRGGRRDPRRHARLRRSRPVTVPLVLPGLVIGLGAGVRTSLGEFGATPPSPAPAGRHADAAAVRSTWNARPTSTPRWRCRCSWWRSRWSSPGPDARG